MSSKVLVFEAYPFFSGSQRITLNVCRILKKNGFHVTLLLVDDRFGSLRKNFEPVVDEIELINASEHLLTYGDEDSWFSKKKFFKSVFGGLLPFYFNCLKQINSKKYDFLYCCDPRGATMMLLSAKLFRKKSILHFHGKNRLPNKLAKLFLNTFDTVACVSGDVARSLPEAGNKVVIYNGIDFSQYSNVDLSAVRNEVGHESVNTAVKFLYVGLLRPHKGLHHLIHAFAKLKKERPDQDFVLYVLGAAKTQAEENFKKILSDFSEKNSITKNIHWLGWKDNVLAWMNYADYFVFPSIDKEDNTFEGFGAKIESTEGLPTVLIESSICKLYSIASTVTGVSEIITPGKNGELYNSNEPDALYNSLNTVLSDLPKFKDFETGENFHLSTFENKILSLFDSKKK
ncbi:Glycosyltransferase involved in cell wall bisynthesis [Mucilaginibacter gossypiicola]|uniref:Glycosyltransferase involved in cell wall bisynthesis n=1 Tax=Mucilaginibacter gossypiicola TaxID=551995 RepID=A0A1H8NBP9_9SPHI|nr:glycosyltransferase family 4 protein [Mucilaginibacter gossypiicola]SEO26869.1 Glycosyltransferase involved in cell wall bisynthesis [Mucilaginibacter gossypiicola]